MTGLARTSLVLAVTGGIACGKSEVGRILGTMDFAVCDADRVAHDLMKKGAPVYQRIVDHFGNSILSEGGEISRPILGKIIFKDPSGREALNGMVHPAVRDELERWVAEKREQGKKAAVLVPLLFESGMDALGWDAVLCVASSDVLVFQRMKKRGIGGNDAERRVAAQMPINEKELKSDYVISNVGTLGNLEQSTRETVKQIMAERVL